MIESILSVVALCLVIALIVITDLLEDKRKKRLEEYYNTLNEHDKSVIATYNVKGRYFYRNGKKRKQVEKKVK